MRNNYMVRIIEIAYLFGHGKIIGNHCFKAIVLKNRSNLVFVEEPPCAYAWNPKALGIFPPPMRSGILGSMRLRTERVHSPWTMLPRLN